MKYIIHKGFRSAVSTVATFALVLAIAGGISFATLGLSSAEAATGGALVPVAVGTYDAWTATGTKVSATATIDGDTSYISAATSGARQSFTVANANIPANSVINSVTINIVARDPNNSGNANVQLFAENGTNAANDGIFHSVSSSYATTSRTMLISPFTIAPWTAAEVNAWTVKFGVTKSSESTNTVRVTQFSVVVDYSEPIVAPNPALTTSCGLDVALLLDTSSSITPTEMGQMKDALASFATAFNGTPTVFSLTTFNTTATVLNNFSMTPAQAVTAVNALPLTSTGNTNWEDGLLRAFSTFDPRPAKPNLIVIATDGFPTVSGADRTPGRSPVSSDRVAAIANAITEANIVKNAGTRILAIGIGMNGPSDLENLKSITGSTVAPPAAIDQNVDVVTADFSTLGVQMANVAKGLCGGKILVQKQFDANNDGTADVTGSALNALLSGYTFAVAGAPSQPTAQTTSNTGFLEFNNVLNGTYSVTESNVPESTRLISASCVNGTSSTGEVNLDTKTVSGLTMGTDDTIECTFVNTPPPPKPRLRIIKHVINDNGGSATASDWTMNVTATNPSSASFAGSESGSDVTVDPGTYSISESGGPAGYTASSTPDCAGSIAAGESETCTITNDDQPASITVTKVVTNTYRGESAVSDFGLFVGLTPVTSGISQLFEAGHYAISEQGPTTGGYHAVFSGDCSGTGITLALGDVKNCTITNNDKRPGTLHVIKTVTNDNAEGYQGTSSAGDFTLSVTGGGNPAPESFAGSEAGTDVVIDAGASFSVSETGGPTSNYALSQSGDCSGTMPEGGSLTCTITSNDNPPTTGGLTVIKVVTNDNGGTKPVSDFPLHVTNASSTITDVSSGHSSQFDGGTYTVSETGDSNYVAIFSGDCNSDGTVTVVNGEGKTCTITNDDKAPSLTLVKQVTNDNGGTSVTMDWTLGAIGPSTISGVGGVTSDSTFIAGIYVLSESVGPAGYTAGDWSCSKNNTEPVSGSSITLAAGDTATCTIVNNDNPGTLHVFKHVINDNGGKKTASNFTMQVTGTNVSSASFPGSEDGTTITFDAGGYSVSEDTVAGYGATLGEDCSGTIGVGESKTCTVTNDDGKATLTIVKNTQGADGTFIFDVSGQASTAVTTTAGTGSTMIALDAGTYTITESQVAGWTLAGATCSNENNPSAVTLATGDSVTCTFTNRASGADLSVAKTVDDTTPDVGQTITYTLTASNAGPAAATGVTVHDTLPAGLTYVSDTSGGAYATSTGNWTILSLESASSTTLNITATVNSGTAGQTIANSAAISTSDEGVSDFNASNNTNDVSIMVNSPNAPTPPSGGGPRGGGGGCAVGFMWNPNTLKCDPKSSGQVLGAATTTGQVLGVSCGLYMDQHLRQGSSKNDPGQVTRLQEFLNKRGFGNFTPTGYFGPLTFKAAKAFQKQYSEEILKPWKISLPTGLVYLTTIRQINLLECPDLVIPIPPLVLWNLNPNPQ